MQSKSTDTDTSEVNLISPDLVMELLQQQLDHTKAGKMSMAEQFARARALKHGERFPKDIEYLSQHPHPVYSKYPLIHDVEPSGVYLTSMLVDRYYNIVVHGYQIIVNLRTQSALLRHCADNRASFSEWNAGSVIRIAGSTIQLKDVLSQHF